MTKNLKIKNKNIADLLAELETHLKRIYKDKISKIILFGSYAKGDYAPDSDINVMVLLKKNDFERYSDELAMVAVGLTAKYSILPSIMVECKKEFIKNIDIQSLYKNVENEGIELYSA
jgi:predicted nucleotidyltransferase